MTFYDWIIRLKNHDTPTGDLARDFLRDQESSKVSNTLEAYTDYLHSQGACRQAVEALKTAWRSYQHYLKTH